MAKGKNKTGPRNADGSPKRKPKVDMSEQPRQSSKFAFNEGRHGNKDNRTSNITPQQAITQLIAAGFEILRLEKGESYKPTQKDGAKWVRAKFGIEDAAVSNTGRAVLMAKPDDDGEFEEEDILTVPINGVNLTHEAARGLEQRVNDAHKDIRETHWER